ncbi:MAG: benzoate-CoA ligase family protein [Cyanobacteria bacterium P01_A01_bin.84]
MVKSKYDAYNNIVEYLLDRHLAEGRGDNFCLHYKQDKYTYSHIFDLVNKAANLFHICDIKQGDRVVLILPDSPLFIVILFGLLRIGAVPVIASNNLTINDYKYILGDSTPKGLAIAKESIPIIEQISESCLSNKYIWVVNEDDEELPTKYTLFKPSLQKSSSELLKQVICKEDRALIQYTSGSTGKPKGVVHLHRGLLEVTQYLPERLELSEHDIFYSGSKLSFSYGFGSSLLFPFAVGASSVLCSNVTTPYSVYKNIYKFQPSIFFGVPTLYASLLRVPECKKDYDLSCIRLCISGGEHLSAILFYKWKETFGHEIINGIGSTECLHLFIAGEKGKIKPGVTGTVVPGYEVKILDDNRLPVKRGEIGKLYIKSKCIAAGYLRHDKKNSLDKFNEWIFTGDMFYQDEEDYYCFFGRADYLIKVGGLKVSYREIEDCLLTHESIKECAVVGNNNNEHELMTIVAYICLNPGWEPSNQTKKTLKQHLLQSIAPYKLPKEINFVTTELPKTTTGKISRSKLRAIGGDYKQIAKCL